MGISEIDFSVKYLYSEGRQVGVVRIKRKKSPPKLRQQCFYRKKQCRVGPLQPTLGYVPSAARWSSGEKVG